jgi:predicted secreted acid phosphatase
MTPLKKLFRILYGILREISDESAYQRHLVTHQRPHSGEEWRRFSEERLRQKYARARCC